MTLFKVFSYLCIVVLCYSFNVKIDKKWMSANRASKEFQNEVDNFLDYCRSNNNGSILIRCPCLNCGNSKKLTFGKVKNHLLYKGIDQSYKTWIFHGETLPQSRYEPTKEDTMGGGPDDDCGFDSDCLPQMVEDMQEDFMDDPDVFESLLADAEKPVYPNCEKFTKLSTLFRLFYIKAGHGMSNKYFSELLAFLKELLPETNEIPSSMYEAKKTLSALGMNYEKIHAFPNNCILYRKELKDSVVCHVCNQSRWKKKKNSEEDLEGIPAKVLWYIPIIPRLVRLFRNPNHAKSLTWHADERVEDGKLRHPADSPSWKVVDSMWPEFEKEPRNLRLGLSADGINPHSSMSTRYSCWPVVIVIYNLPPWLCMRRRFMFLSLLISGPNQPANDIDVYLAPLIDDLNILWKDGVKAYDSLRKDEFMLKVVLLWTINDFPTYGNLSGCSVKGYLGCPICEQGTCSRWLKHGSKVIYDGHRRYLPLQHPFRRWKKAFNGEQEFEIAPRPLSGIEVEQKLSKISFK